MKENPGAPPGARPPKSWLRASLLPLVLLALPAAPSVAAPSAVVAPDPALAPAPAPLLAPPPVAPPAQLPAEEQWGAEVMDAQGEPAKPGFDELVASVIASHEGDFPMVDNALVRTALTKMVGSSTGRRHMRAVLARYRGLSGTVLPALDGAGLPRELAAVPVLESGYVPSARDPAGPSGLWMFVPGTAQHFGLRVSSGVDDRMDPERATDAAARYFKSLRTRFDDWVLVLAAYNQGHGSIQSVMARYPGADGWELIRRGAIKDYGARVVAAAFVLDEPRLAED